MAQTGKQFTIEGAEIAFRNFSGKEGQYNAEGQRGFLLILRDEKFAQKLLDDGWNVKYLRPQEEGEAPTACLSVTVRFDKIPPKIIAITSVARTRLTEDMVDTLDYADISNIDLIVTASSWEVNGKTGLKAYLKSLYATIEEDELERKYEI